MSDMIDRDATIGALRYECEKLSEFMDKCLATGEYGLRAGAKTERKRIEEDIYILENMPPAQPDITKCSECRKAEERGCALFCEFWGRYTTHRGFCFKSEKREDP